MHFEICNDEALNRSSSKERIRFFTSKICILLALFLFLHLQTYIIMDTIIKKYSQLLLLAACLTLFSGCDFKPATASLEDTVWEHEFSQSEQKPDGLKKAVLYFNNQKLTYYALSADGKKKYLIASYPYTLEEHLLTAGNQHAIVGGYSFYFNEMLFVKTDKTKF
jgi:putative outermembrane protein